MAGLTGVMLAAIPGHVHRVHAPATPVMVRHVENCVPEDQWLVEARSDLVDRRYHVALRHVALSRRDCAYDPERDRIEAIAYAAIGDQFASIAAAARYLDAVPDGEPALSRALEPFTPPTPHLHLHDLAPLRF